uniref:Uncharacterized protein n=1 Tax=Anguilla anguilla TaxID=7936 RepID=A0A0E9TQH6_ANGAN
MWRRGSRLEACRNEFKN